jgi:hypothetical protein
MSECCRSCGVLFNRSLGDPYCMHEDCPCHKKVYLMAFLPFLSSLEKTEESET